MLAKTVDLDMFSTMYRVNHPAASDDEIQAHWLEFRKAQQSAIEQERAAPRQENPFAE